MKKIKNLSPKAKLILVWILLWWWFLYNRMFRSYESRWDSNCKCGEPVECDNENWSDIYKWRNWLVTYTDFYSPASWEYGGTEWTVHTICWKCGRYHVFLDSSV